jgi:rubredoxin
VREIDNNKQRGNQMEKYECELCGYIYDPVEGDPDGGVKPGTAFADIHPDWLCPLCSAGLDSFKPVD